MKKYYQNDRLGTARNYPVLYILNFIKIVQNWDKLIISVKKISKDYFFRKIGIFKNFSRHGIFSNFLIYFQNHQKLGNFTDVTTVPLCVPL